MVFTMSTMVPYQKKEIKMKLLIKIFTLGLLTSTITCPIDSIISMFVRKYPYFKKDHSSKFNAEKYSQKLKQPAYLYKSITRPHSHHESISGVMHLYGGQVALSDQNGQVNFKRRQQISNIYLLVTTGIKPAYIIAPSTVHNWRIDPTKSSKMYLIQLKQDANLDLHYYNVELTNLPADNNIPLNTIILIADPEYVLVPTGATVSQYSSNLILPDIYLKRGFCFIYNQLYTLAIKQYFDSTVVSYQQENQTVSKIQQRP